MTRVNHEGRECGANIPLAVADGESDIKCPECGVWFALPPRLRDSEAGVHCSDEGHSNAGLWIGLAIGGGLLLLLAVCGGLGAIFWGFTTSQRQQARRADMQAQVAFQAQGNGFQRRMAPENLFAPPT